MVEILFNIIMNITALIAGGAGFIGSHLCKKLLEKNYHVICVDNLITSSKNNIRSLIPEKKFTFIKQDILKKITITSKLDFVYHLASPASPNHHSPISYHSLPYESMMANTVGTDNLLKIAEKHNAKFLFTSTSEIYGDPLEHPQKETYYGNVNTTGPRSVYDEAKRFGETITFYYWSKKNVDARIARIFNTYGPTMHKDDMRMILLFIQQALTSKPITIFGDGTQTRSLCYVDDIVKGLIRLMEYPHTKGQIVNLGSTDEHSVYEYAKLIKKLTKSKSPIYFSEPLPENDPRKRKPDISKAIQLLGWKPEIKLEEGLICLIQWVKKSQNL